MAQRVMIYYGDGNCTIEKGENIRGIQIWYKGKVKIIDKTPDGYERMESNNQILIFAIRSTKELSDLFSYKGEFQITKVILADNNANQAPSFIKRVMDYSELLHSNAEDLTVKAEDIKAGYVSGVKVGRTSISKGSIENLNTADQEGSLYLSDGTEYHGYFHIHKNDASAMTGRVHSDTSEDLYFYQKGKLLPTKNPSHIPQGHKIIRQKRKARLIAESKGGHKRKLTSRSNRGSARGKGSGSITGGSSGGGGY